MKSRCRPRRSSCLNTWPEKTPLRFLKQKYERVRTYGNADEFCRITEKYMAMKSDDPYWNALKREMLENIWDARTDHILEVVDASAGHRSASE